MDFSSVFMFHWFMVWNMPVATVSEWVPCKSFPNDLFLSQIIQVSWIYLRSIPVRLLSFVLSFFHSFVLSFFAPSCFSLFCALNVTSENKWVRTKYVLKESCLPGSFFVCTELFLAFCVVSTGVWFRRPTYLSTPSNRLQFFVQG